MTSDPHKTSLRVIRAVACATIIVIACSSAARATNGPASVTTLHRLYDMTPVSEANPIIARVANSDIEISLSELQSYVKTLPPEQVAAPNGEKALTAVEKRRCLDRLLNEHFLLSEGYRHKVDESDKVKKMLTDTQAMLMEETLVKEEVGDKAKTSAEYQALSEKLLGQIFDKAAVEISNESWAELKAAVKRAAQSKETNPSAMTLLSEVNRNAALVRVENISVAIGDVLDAYLLIPPEKRPDINTQHGLAALLKALVGEQLLAIEARARGLDHAPRVLEFLQLNRNVLVRTAVIDHLTGETIKRMKLPETESRLHAWYEANKARFTSKENDGTERVAPFEEVRQSVENQYFDENSERLREEYQKKLREGHRVEYSEELLAHADVERPHAAPTTLADSVVAWDADRQDYKVKDGETTAVFIFRFTNVSKEPVTIYHLEPSCDCTNVSSAALPWTIAPGEHGEMTVAVDVRGKSGSYARTVTVDSNQGLKTLTMDIHAPEKTQQAAPRPGA